MSLEPMTWACLWVIMADIHKSVWIRSEWPCLLTLDALLRNVMDLIKQATVCAFSKVSALFVCVAALLHNSAEAWT